MRQLEVSEAGYLLTDPRIHTTCKTRSSVARNTEVPYRPQTQFLWYGEKQMTCIICTLLSIHTPSFMKIAEILFDLLQDPDLIGQSAFL